MTNSGVRMERQWGDDKDVMMEGIHGLFQLYFIFALQREWAHKGPVCNKRLPTPKIWTTSSRVGEGGFEQIFLLGVLGFCLFPSGAADGVGHGPCPSW